MFDRTRFENGQDVYDVNGHKVGSINDVTTDYLDVSAGFLGFDRLHIPFDQVSRVENDRVYLAVPKDEIGNKNWRRAPAGTTGAPGMYGTMPAATVENPSFTGGIPTELSGYDIFTSDDHNLGTVEDWGSNFVHLQSGFLGLGQDLYIPTDCIDRCDSNDRRCFLNFSRDQISNMQWNRRPAPGEAYSCDSGREALRNEYDTTERPWREGTNLPQDEFARGETEQDDLTRGETEVERIPLVESGGAGEVERQQLGEVDITKRVVEKHVSYDVPVSHDEVRIREVPVDRPTDVEPNEQGDIRVPMYGESVDVGKGNRVYGEIDVEKRRVTDQRHVEGTIRREVPDIHREGDVEDDVTVEDNLEKRDDNNPPRRMTR